MEMNIRINCLLERSWDVVTKSFTGAWCVGTLIGLSTETATDGKIVPVGIVALDTGQLHSVPIPFMKKESIN